MMLTSVIYIVAFNYNVHFVNLAIGDNQGNFKSVSTCVIKV